MDDTLSGTRASALPGMNSIDQSAPLQTVKIVHTIIWATFVACIVAVWVFALRGALFEAAVAIGFVAIEVRVLLVNGMCCPHIAIAAHCTKDRRDNFDIYLPLWLARYNKHIFGVLYITYTFSRSLPRSIMQCDSARYAEVKAVERTG